ncbi:MAG: hypothetical protein LAN59_10440 [Acidobacteriia bacterium]|nr:hypothetical protein [Terriglobia bacterium]
MRGMQLSRRPARLLCAAVMALACTCLTSCVTFALHSLYGDADSVFEPGLLGTWNDPTDESNRIKLIFEKGQGSSYKATFIDPDSKPPDGLIFEVHLVKINGQLFFDAVQTGVRAKGQEVDMGIVIPSHLIGRLSLTADTLRLDLLDDSWFKQSLKSGKSAIPFEIVFQ